MHDETRIADAAHHLAAAIARRDPDAVRAVLAPGFVLRTPGGPSIDAAAFVAGLAQIPGEILFVRLEGLEVAPLDGSALVTGVQHASVRVDGKVVDDRRPFADVFVRSDDDGAWRVKLALDLPALP